LLGDHLLSNRCGPLLCDTTDEPPAIPDKVVKITILSGLLRLLLLLPLIVVLSNLLWCPLLRWRLWFRRGGGLRCWFTQELWFVVKLLSRP
jgi:hypothetical protein